MDKIKIAGHTSSSIEDGRPCSMDEFVSKLFEVCDDHYDRDEAIKYWLHGQWDEAMEYLNDQ